MKTDDRLMVVLTAVVLTVAVGTMVQKTDVIMAAFTSPDEYQPIDDSFTVRAGRSQALDVLSNDMNVQEGDGERLLVVSPPLCGTVRRNGGQLEYLQSDSCGGRMTFSYCVIQGDACPPATVTLNVSLPEALDGRPLVADSNFPTLRAPALVAPDSSPNLSASDSVATLRAIPQQPAGMIRPSLSAGVGMARQESAQVNIGAAALGTQSSGFGSAPAISATSTEIAALQREPGAAMARPAAPQLPGPLEGARQPGAAPQTGGQIALQAPNVGEVDSTTPTVITPPPPPATGFRRLANIFLPAAEPETGAAIVADRSTGRPNIQGPSSLDGDTGIVTERAAQIIVPSNSDNDGGLSGNTPVLPVDTLASLPTLPSVPQIGGGAAEAEVMELASLPDAPAQAAPVVEAPVAEAPLPSCDAFVTLTGLLGESLAVTVVSECRPDTLVTLEHAGLMFDMITDEAGRLQFELPAMAERAIVSARFADGTAASAEILVRGVERSARTGISWDGNINFDLTAFEFGAVEGDDGHVWEGAPRSYRESRREGGGYLTKLGLAGLNQTEIYTLPITRRTATGVVDMIISIGEGSLDCERPVRVNTVQMDRALQPSIRDVTLQIGDCAVEDRSRLSFTTGVQDIVIATR